MGHPRAIIFVLFLLISAPARAEETARQRLYSTGYDQKQAADLEAKIIVSFNEEGCEKISTIVSRGAYPRLLPRALAIVAYCVLDASESERLFARAERAAPSSDVVVMLHARRLAERDPARAEIFWRKLLLLARSTHARVMARNYLEGKGDPKEAPVVDTPWLVFSALRLDFGRESNPQVQLLGDRDAPSAFAKLLLYAGAQRDLTFGNFAANTTLTRYQYTSRPTSNLLQADLELPLTLRAGTNEDIRITPYAQYQQLEYKPFYYYGGLKIAGVAFRGHYKQTVQGSFFYDGYYTRALNFQAGSHFRFDYTWELYPENWLISATAYIEHVHAGREVARAPTLNIPYSHNDIGTRLAIEYNFKWLLVGINAAGLWRIDDLSSIYQVGAAGTELNRRRHDLGFVLEPIVTVPFDDAVALVASYKIVRNVSNMGPTDYRDLSYGDSTISVGVRVYLGNL